MALSPDLTGFGWLMSIGGILVGLSVLNSRQQKRAHRAPSRAENALHAPSPRIAVEMEQQTRLARASVQDAAFEQLQPLLTSFPTVRKMAQEKPDLPAANLTALFTPLENLLQSWGYEPIGRPWEPVPFNPQLHQPDADDISAGEQVYVRFVGYRQGDRIVSPAKVSRSLPDLP